MKNKLKMVFTYFRGLNTDVLGTGIVFDHQLIEEWDEKFYYTKKDGYKGFINLPSVIVKVFGEIINQIQPEFKEFNDYEYREIWHLNIVIYPFENKMVFTSECMTEKKKPLKSFTHVDDIPFTPESKNYLNDIFDYGVIKKIDIVFYGRWDDGEVYQVYVNDIKTRLDGEDEENYWNIINDTMRDLLGQWWNAEYGVEGKITIHSNDKVVFDINEFYTEYESTDMNIKITLNNI